MHGDNSRADDTHPAHISEDKKMNKIDLGFNHLGAPMTHTQQSDFDKWR